MPAFARLIELLATHTKAKHINILAYSAGAQVIAPGLAYLADAHPDLTEEELKKKLRIGEVYFAAPDAEFQSFAERYLKFTDIVGRTTINVNNNDSVLRISAFQNGFASQLKLIGINHQFSSPQIKSARTDIPFINSL